MLPWQIKTYQFVSIPASVYIQLKQTHHPEIGNFNITMTKLKPIGFLLCTLLFFGCSVQTESDSNIFRVVITDQNGDPLPQYAVQIIDVNSEWLSKPETTLEGFYDEQIQSNLPGDKAVFLKFAAPGYLPKYTFLMPGFGSVQFAVSLRSLPLSHEPHPQVFGNFNDFDGRAALDMQQNEEGIWFANLETDLDTLHYFIGGYSLFALPGTDGELRVNEETPTFDRVYFTELVKSEGASEFTIQFDPRLLPSDIHESAMEIKADPKTETVGKIYGLFIDEYNDLFSSNMLHQISGMDGQYEHDFSGYISSLATIISDSVDPEIIHAETVTRFRFDRYVDLNTADIQSLLTELPAESSIWMMNLTAITDAVDKVGIADHVDLLTEISTKSSYEGLRGEALYNLIRYYHQTENKEKLGEAFFEFVSNYPDHFRTGFIYQNYAPEQPIDVGRPLPVNKFSTLDGEGTLNLFDLEESYLLIDFWATWCGPCIQAMPNLHEVQERFGGDQFSIVGISIDERPSHVEGFRGKWEMPWHHAFEGYQSHRLPEMGVVGVPYYVLLDVDRNVVSHDQNALRGENMITTLRELLEDGE